MVHNYEAVIAFSADLDEAGIRAQVEKIEAIIRAHGGTLERQDTWGRRQFGFRIAKKTSGVYTLFIFSGDNTLVADLDRQLRINESVLRHMIVVKDKHAPDLVAGAHPDESFAFGSSDGVGEFDDGIGGPADLNA